MTSTMRHTLAMRGLGALIAVVAGLGTATAATAVPARHDYRAAQIAQARMYLHGWACENAAVEGPRAIVRTADRVHVVPGRSVAPLTRNGSQLLYWCHRRDALQADEIAVGTETNPLFVHNAPNTNTDGGSWAWADYGLYQILHATRPSPAAKALCQLDAAGESIWVSGGMMSPGQWATVSVTAFSRRASDVDITVDDPTGTHGGNCSPIGLVLRKVT